jgi:hypothetical protein
MSNPGPNIVSESILRGQAVLSVAVTPASVSAATSAEQTFTVSGLAVGDFVAISTTASTGNATAITSARVSAANTLAIRYINPTAGALTPAADTYLVYVARAYPAQTAFGDGKLTNLGIIAAQS